MNVIIIGCGRVGGELAYRLYQKQHKVVVVDLTASAFQNLPADFRGRFVEGNALNVDVLCRAGIQDADALAAVTSNDTVNAVIAHLSSDFFLVPSVVVRNFDSRSRPLHEMFGLQMVSASSWGAQRIEELLLGQKARTVFSAGNGEVDIYEFVIEQEWDGCFMEELLPDRNCLPVALTRAGRAVIPTTDMILKQGDIVLVSATFEGIEKLQNNLATKKTNQKERA